MHKRVSVVSAQPQQHGFTLLEVLVAVLVLAIGIVGMIGLQAASLQANRDTRQQSSAVRLATELGEMMRANKQVAIQTSSTANPYLISNFTGTLPTAPSSACQGGASSCTALQVAQSDIYGWLTRIQGTSTVPGELSGARVVVCFDATPYDSSGLPQWSCSGTGGLVVVKIGWTRQAVGRAGDGVSTTSGGQLGLDQASRPGVVMPLIAGNT